MTLLGAQPLIRSFKIKGSGAIITFLKTGDRVFKSSSARSGIYETQFATIDEGVKTFKDLLELNNLPAEIEEVKV